MVAHPYCLLTVAEGWGPITGQPWGRGGVKSGSGGSSQFELLGDVASSCVNHELFDKSLNDLGTVAHSANGWQSPRDGFAFVFHKLMSLTFLTVYFMSPKTNVAVMFLF